MILFIIAILLQLSLVLLAGASPVELSSLVHSPMKYIGPITPGGENVTLEGHAEDIHLQIRALNPDFDPMEFEVVQRAVNASIEPRAFSKSMSGKPQCNIKTPGYDQRAYTLSIFEGVSYLRNLPGDCGAVGHHSTRVSCSWKSAIYMVVNNQFGAYESCQHLASLALAICNECETLEKGVEMVNGQVHNSDDYIAIVAGADC